MGGLVASGAPPSCMYKVADTTLTGAATSVAFTGLSISDDVYYLIFLKLKNATANAYELSLYVNGDTTAANYTSQELYGQNAGTGAAYVNNKALIGTLVASDEYTAVIAVMRTPNGYTRALVNSAAVSNLVDNYVVCWSGTTAWTQLAIYSSGANSLATGSRITIYAVKPI